MASLLLPPQFACSLPYYCTRGQLHYKPTIWGKNMTKTKMGLLPRNVSFVSKKSSQDVEEGSSGEDSDAETPKTKKKPAKRGRKKATIDASIGETQDGQSDTEDASPEEPKIVKKRGRKKAATTASSTEEADKPKEPKKRGRRKIKTVEQLSDDEGEEQSKDSMPSNEMEVHSSVIDLESKVEALLLQDIGEVDKLVPLVCCFGPAKYSFIPSGRPAKRLVDPFVVAAMSSWNSHYPSSCNFAAYDEVDKDETSTNKAYVRNLSPAPVDQHLCDVDMLSRGLVASNERDQIIDKKSDYHDNKLKFIDQKDKLVAEIDSPKELRLMKDDWVQLRTLKVHYRLEGDSNRNKFHGMKIILQRCNAHM